MRTRRMLVALLGVPTDDCRLIESLDLEPGRRHRVAGSKRTVELAEEAGAVYALVPWWWHRQLTLALYAEDLDTPEDLDAAIEAGEPVLIFRRARVLALSPVGRLPWTDEQLEAVL